MCTMENKDNERKKNKKHEQKIPVGEKGIFH
jgi:hypothetical protein